MRRARPFIFLLLLAAFTGLSFPVLAQSSGLTFRVWTSPAPNRYTSEGGIAWNAYQSWVANAMNSIENNKGNIGDPSKDPGAFRIVNRLVPREYAVSGNPSWRTIINPTAPFNDQYGNSMHFPMHVKGDGAVRFKYEDFSWCIWTVALQGSHCNTMKLTRPHSSGAWDRVDCTYGWGYDWGADRAKGGGDDTKVCGGTQTERGNFDTTLVDELFYVGANYGHAADHRYNNTSFPEYADYTLQEVIADYCKRYNNDANLKTFGLEFTIVGSDDNTYTHVAKRSNPEWGKALQPDNCRPYPETPKPTPAAVKAAPTPVICSGEVLQAQGYGISTQYGLCSGIQFQRRDASAVGIQSVIEAGFIDAVDVWGYASQTAEVCLPYTSGVLVFLDANTTPRVATPLASVIQNGFICATVNGPGLVVLVESWHEAAEPEVRDLQNCMVTATANLNFRDGPAGAIIGFVRKDWKLTAAARTDDWFKVDLHGIKGWISAEYVETDGSCD